jgi:hypothetical protein
MAGVSHAQGLVVMAKKVSGELPLDPDSSLWKGASSVEIRLAPQAMAMPRIYESVVKDLRVRALHNTTEIVFLVEWSDRTEDSALDLDRFSDAVALQFPSSEAQSKPHFGMGDKENTVNIWFWRAAWQKPAPPEKAYAMVDDFAPGAQAGNPVSKQRTTPVECIIARGFGSATNREKAADQSVAGSGAWQSNRWAVVFKRSLSVKDAHAARFIEGGVTPVSFAVWNGSEKERGGRKVVSTWYYVGLETEEKKSTYFYPVVGFIAALGIEAGIILGIRKRRKA